MRLKIQEQSELNFVSRIIQSRRIGIWQGRRRIADASVNLLTNPALDPIGKIPEYKICAVKVEAA